MQINRHHFISIDSTNTWAKLNAASFPKNQLTIVTAEAQTAGRGRFNRQWISPPKENIYATFCFFEKNLNPNVGNIPQVMAISIAKTLELFGFKPSLKWPNDILINNKKIGGILTETVAVDDLIAILIGVGINVNMPMETLAQIGRPATSLMSESNRIFQTEEILKRLEEQFNKDLQLFLETGFESFFNYYQKHFFISSGHSIKFHDGATLLEGTFDMLHKDGSMSLRLTNGTLKKCIAGELIE